MNPEDGDHATEDSSHGANNSAGTESDFRNEIDRLHDFIREHDARSNNALIETIVRCATLAEAMMSDASLWAEFCQRPEWQGVKGRPREAGRDVALRFVLRWSCGTDKSGSKTASKYFRAIGPLLEAGTAPVDLPTQIHNGGGLKELAKAHSQNHRERQTKSALIENAEPVEYPEIDKPDAIPVELVGKIARHLVRKAPKRVHAVLRLTMINSICRIEIVKWKRLPPKTKAPSILVVRVGKLRRGSTQ